MMTNLKSSLDPNGLNLSWPQLKTAAPNLVKSTWFEINRWLTTYRANRHQQTYRPFIILGRSRTGSTLLLRALANHPRTIAYGELFRNDQINWVTRFGWQTAMRRQTYEAAPVQLLQDQVFCAYPASIQAVGFKLFYYHAQHAGWKHLWQYLAAQTDLHVIHVKRRNLLATHVSRQIAGLGNEWNKTTDNRPKSAEPLIVDIERCRRDFEQTRAWEREFTEHFHQQTMLTLTYENLSTQFTTEMARVQEFLGLTTYLLEPVTVKLSTQPLADRIGNYRQLKAAFSNTEWASFFDEE